MTEKNRVDLVLDPKEVPERKSLFKYLIPSSSKKYTVAFLYPKSTEESNWTYAHDLGRAYLEETFPDQISTICVDHVNAENVEEVLIDVIAKGAKIVFEVGVEMMEPSLKIAMEHPEVTILIFCQLQQRRLFAKQYFRW